MSIDEYREEISALVDLDEDALLVRLAGEVVLGVGPLDPNRKRSIARSWMEAQRDRLRSAVCGSAQIEVLRQSASDERIETAAAVADLVAAVTGKLPAATVAMLLVRTGLDSLCA
jgi:hypothetical protein